MLLRRRQKKPKKQREKEIAVGSFSDIAFLLIIYFMVATTLVTVKSVEANMPAGEKSDQQSEQDDTPSVDVVNGVFKFNDKPVKLEQLNARLAALKLAEKKGEKRVVLLQCTDNTPYELYFKALAAITDNGGVVAMVEEDDQ
jgi:biopolymer transport protein ExbD